MGFWAGFADEFSKMIDRQERRELLMQELGATRQSALIKAYQARTTRTSSRAQEEGALKLIQARVGDVEGGEEFLEALRTTGTASIALKKIAEVEGKPGENELYLTGETLINSFNIAGGDNPDIRPSRFLQNLIAGDSRRLADNETFAAAQLEVGSLPKEESGVVDFNPRAVFQGSNKVRGDVSEVFFSNLATRTALGAQTAEQRAKQAELAGDMEAASQARRVAGDLRTATSLLNSEDSGAKTQARATWAISPYGLKTYEEMATNPEIPSYQELNKMDGVFAPLRSAYDLNQNWDSLSPEEQEEGINKYPFLRDFREIQ